MGTYARMSSFPLSVAELAYAMRDNNHWLNKNRAYNLWWWVTCMLIRWLYESAFMCYLVRSSFSLFLLSMFCEVNSIVDVLSNSLSLHPLLLWIRVGVMNSDIILIRELGVLLLVDETKSCAWVIGDMVKSEEMIIIVENGKHVLICQ